MGSSLHVQTLPRQLQDTKDPEGVPQMRMGMELRQPSPDAKVPHEAPGTTSDGEGHGSGHGAPVGMGHRQAPCSQRQLTMPPPPQLGSGTIPVGQD